MYHDEDELLKLALTLDVSKKKMKELRDDAISKAYLVILIHKSHINDDKEIHCNEISRGTFISEREKRTDQGRETPSNPEP